ncbi:MAG: tetratricopeptide repeat protein, partial [Nannocystaceae bacterium]
AAPPPPDLLARGLVEYLSVTVSLGRIAQAWKWERRAREAVQAIGSPPELSGRMEYSMALAESYAGHPERSFDAALRAREHFVEGGATSRRWVSTAENLLGELVFESGRYDEALPHYERALDIATEEMGTEHTWVAGAHGNMAEVFFLSGRYEQAQHHFEEALRIREGCFGPTSVWVIHTLAHLGDVALARGTPAEALARYELALEARVLLRRMAGDRPANDDEILTVYRDLQAWDQDQWLYYGMALSLLQLGRIEEARALVQQVPEPRVALDHHHPDLISRLDVPGWVELAAGQLPEAIGAFERALDSMEEQLGPRHHLLVHPLLGLGQAHLQSGSPDQARPYLERALRLHEVRPVADPRLRGDLRLSLARALVERAGRLDDARALATQARDDYRGVPNGDPARLEAADSWLLAHGGALNAGPSSASPSPSGSTPNHD